MKTDINYLANEIGALHLYPPLSITLSFLVSWNRFKLQQMQPVNSCQLQVFYLPIAFEKI